MRESGNFAPGTEFSEDSPWNEPMIPDEKFNVTCSQTLSKTVTVTTNNYIPGASGVDWEMDEGRAHAIPYNDPPDTSDTNWGEEYHENGYHTPIQLIGILKGYIEKDLMYDDSRFSKEYLRHLLEECEGWCEDDVEYIEE